MYPSPGPTISPGSGRGHHHGLRRRLPGLPGKRCEDRGLDDPEGKTLEDVRPIRDEIGRRVKQLVDELLPVG
jgi:hypothetical protein